MTNLSLGQTKWNLEDDGCGGVKWKKGLYGNSEEEKFDLAVREISLSAIPSQLKIEGSKNGGVRIKGWDKNEVRIKVCIQTSGKTEEEVREILSTVNITTDGGTIKAVSPYSTIENVSYNVNYDIKVPKNLDLNITTLNGGINISEIESVIYFNVDNGGAILNQLAGDVSGKIKNGSVAIKLAGKEWKGKRLDAQVGNGNILFLIPKDYSAQIETGTRRGSLVAAIGTTKQRVRNNILNLNVGSGGTLLRALTERGNVEIRQ